MPLHHEKLIAWQRADDLFIDIHRLTATYPTHERYGLTAQIRRAAYSVPANIVEGVARRSVRDRIRFLNIAEASLGEVTYCLHASHRLGYIQTHVHDCQQRAKQVGAPLSGLVRSLRVSFDSATS